MNNELKINVDKQQDDIKDLKEQCDMDDEDEVQEITDASNTPMKENLPVCVTCDQTFTMNQLNHTLSIWLQTQFSQPNPELGPSQAEF